MESLPPEILGRVLDFLGATDTVALACVGYEYYLLALAHLYHVLTFYVDPYTADLAPRSVQLLVQVHADRDVRGNPLHRMGLVREIAVLPCPGPCFRVTPRAFRTLYATFYQLLRANSIKCNLQRFEWRMGCPEGLDRFPLTFAAHLRVLDCAACQIDPGVLFPCLKTLALRRARAIDGIWLTLQIQHCRLEHLSISGINSTETIQSSCFAQKAEPRLDTLKRLELEYVHVDVWLLPPATKLEQLSLRFCSEGDGLYDPCIPNLGCLKRLEVVSVHDVWASDSFKQMLWSCAMLEELTLLIGGRTSNIPIRALLPLRSSIQALILEARLFSIAPALNYQYTFDDVHLLLREMPNLRILGVSIELSGRTWSHVRPIRIHLRHLLTKTTQTLLSAQPLLRVFHLRNWLTPEQAAMTAENMTVHLSTTSIPARHRDTIVVLSDRCYKVARSANGARLTTHTVQDGLCRRYIVPWHVPT